jgi:hypothetical protein
LIAVGHTLSGTTKSLRTKRMEIITKPFALEIHGYSAIAAPKEYVETAFKLMDRMWRTVKSNNIKNKGLNIFVYDQHDEVFAGVELNDAPEPRAGLERKNIFLTKYAYHKLIGPYSLIRQTGQDMRDELKNKGLEIIPPYVEIYGHWTSDESKLETELILCLK